MTGRGCPSCGSPHAADATWCGRCGARLNPSADDPEPPGQDVEREPSDDSGWPRWATIGLAAVVVIGLALGVSLHDGPEPPGARIPLPSSVPFDAAASPGTLTVGHIAAVLPSCQTAPNMAARLADQPCARWTVRSPALDGTVLATPTVVYLTRDGGFVEARRRHDGAQAWAVDLGAPARLRVASAGGLLVTVEDREIAAIDDVGRVRWRRRLPADIDPLPGTTRTITRVLPRDDTVYVHAGSELLALDAGTGAVRWRWSDQHVLSAGTSGTLPYVIVSDGVIALDPPTGVRRWRVELVTITNRPHRADTRAIVVGDDTSQVVAIDPANGGVRWSFDTGPGPPSTLELTRDAVIVQGTRGRLWRLDRTTGVIGWQRPSRRERLELASVDHEVITHSADTGALVVLDARSGRERWRWEPGSTRGLGLDGDRVLAASDRTLAFLDRADGTPTWRDRLPAPVRVVAGTRGPQPALIALADFVIAIDPPASP